MSSSHPHIEGAPSNFARGAEIADKAPSLASRLLDRSTGLIVWGGGYVGLSTAMHFAAKGVKTQIIDIDQNRVEAINSGRAALPQFEEWVGFALHPLVQGKMLHASAELTITPGRHIHVVAVPTEESGLPSSSAIFEVMGKISQLETNLCIIESTLVPRTAEVIAKRFPHLRFAIAPRRDWFLGPGLDLRSLPRVIGGSCREAVEDASSVLSIVSDHLVEASSASVAEMTKVVENGIHHLMASYTSELARAFPEIDINEVFKLAASHWRIGTVYFASSGTGGYCVPLASRSLTEAAPSPESISLVSAALSFEEEQRKFVGALLSRKSAGSVGFLGVSYRGDVPILTLSPFVDIARKVHSYGRTVYVHDPYFESGTGELKDFHAFNFPEDLSLPSLIFVGASHHIYKSCPSSELLPHLREGQIIFDNEGTWEEMADEFRGKGVIYHRIGGNGWY